MVFGCLGVWNDWISRYTNRPVSSVLDKFIEDKDKKAQLAHEIATMSERHANEVVKAQLEINKTEAQHSSVFVSGWRPAMGGCAALGWQVTFNYSICKYGTRANGNWSVSSNDRT